MKSIHIGIVGCGLAGKAYAQTFLEAGATRVWVQDVNEAAARAAASRPEIQALSTFEEIVHHQDIDAVIITAPNGFHAQMAIQAIEAGKHVLLEKPMALNAADAEAVIETAERHNRILHIGFELRNSGFPLLVKKLIKNGEIGSLISAQVIHYRGHFWPKWKGSLASGGDMFLMETCHTLDLFRWWSEDEVETVHAIGTNRNVVPHYEYPDTQFVTFVFRNGFVAHTLECHTRSAMPDSQSDPHLHLEPQFGHQYEYSIVGENGSLHYLPMQHICHLYRHELQPDGQMQQRLTRSIEFADSHAAIHDGTTQIRQFIQWLRGERGPLIEPRDALQTHMVCFAGYEALQSGQPVSPRQVFSREPTGVLAGS